MVYLTYHHAIAQASRPALHFTTIESMLILLPPSEGKTAPTNTPPVDLGLLSFPELTEARERILGELMRVSEQEDALARLKVGKTLEPEVERNSRLLSEPADVASSIYSGVLYDALDFSGLTPPQKELAQESVLIISALWGAVRLFDAIPAYRLSMGVKLGECGNLATFWRGELSPVLDRLAQENLILDCRSSAYTQAWRPPAGRTVTVRVEQEDSYGERKVVSHFAKHYRGLLARYIVEQGLTHLNDPQALTQELSQEWRVELVAPQDQKAGTLTLVVPAPAS